MIDLGRLLHLVSESAVIDLRQVIKHLVSE